MQLTPEATSLWVQFHDAVEQDLAPGGALHAIRPFGAKMAEHAGRLAAVLTVYEAPDAIEVDAEAMACGINLAQHYAAEMLRLQGRATISSDLRLAERLLAWWQARQDPRCYLAAIYQRGLNAIDNATTARRIVTVLENHGWVLKLPADTVLDGSQRQEAWVLVP